VTGSYDPELNLVIWGTGNPAPDWNGDVRPGDNLYADSAIALDADTGALKWHFQFVQHDTHDWDAVQIPVLVDADWRGRPRKLVYWAHRGGFFYVLDRSTGEFLAGKPFMGQTWAKGLDDQGRPVLIPGMEPTEAGVVVAPGVQGGTNWYSPSFNPLTNFFYLSVWENKGIFKKGEAEYTAGNRYPGSLPASELTDDPGYGAIRAIDPKTGQRVWEHKMQSKPWTGVLSTGGRLLFGGTGGGLARDDEAMEAYFYALDAESGKELWRISLGGSMAANPITYTVNGKQMVTTSAGSGLFTFTLP
jgi:alcohol dehydrogenase (cytochrome c)